MVTVYYLTDVESQVITTRGRMMLSNELSYNVTNTSDQLVRARIVAYFNETASNTTFNDIAVNQTTKTMLNYL